MLCKETNSAINAKLRTEYLNATDEMLVEWGAAFGETPPCRINEFGIIDEERYDADHGILFICRETNGWSDKDYQSGCLFRGWMQDISRTGLEGRGHVQRHPNMWYNIGRWIALIHNPSVSFADVSGMRASAITEIGKIAYTNVNKVRGKEGIGKEYYQLAGTKVVGDMLKREIEIINPKIIVCCGTEYPVVDLIPNYSGKIIKMPHPGARKSTASMLQMLHSQLV